MPFMVADIDKERLEMQKLIDENPELAEFASQWDEEYERRKKLVLARESAKPHDAEFVMELVTEQ
ncbi:MAG: hypothetical protein FWB74_07885 [Defluviitaleaceae bacterium]|nr:hypothetical protein [Defluviitaleaceae bacterium]